MYVCLYVIYLYVDDVCAYMNRKTAKLGNEIKSRRFELAKSSSSDG